MALAIFSSAVSIRIGLVARVGVFVALAFAVAALYEPFWIYPSTLFVPMRDWLTDFFVWLGRDAELFGIAFRDVTRLIADILKAPLNATEFLLYRGFRDWGIGPIPWIALVLGLGILGHWIAGWRLALFVAGCMLYLAVFGLWKDSMRTLSVVLVSVPFAAGIGLGLGIWVTRSKRAAAVFYPMFDLMQATPHMAYLVPVVILFGFGQVPAMIATVIFAMPPMARCTILAIQTVPPDIIESGRMSGCTSRQLLWKVQLPSGKRILMLGLNQVVMQTLAMAVIASLVGATGLGQKLLFSLQQLKLGAAVEQGLAIVLIALVLDRLTQAYANKPVDHTISEQSILYRYRHLILCGVVLAVSVVLAMNFREATVYPRQFTLSLGQEIDVWVRWFSKHAYDYIGPVRDFITVYMLIPLRDLMLWLPWSVWFAFVLAFSWHFGGRAVFFLSLMMLLQILVYGFWEAAILTVYLVLSAAIICVFIGLPIGVWAARSERAAKPIMAICDTLQTFPSFIYLIPVIMLLKVGDLSNIVAILAYATVPTVRYTYLGLKRIPPVIIEAAKVSGTTPWQRLVKVEMPVAIPEIMLGINQTIMMALAMVAITALIGSRDLGQEIYRALPTSDTGRGVIAGLSIAAIGIITDRIIGGWAKKRKQVLGIEG